MGALGTIKKDMENYSNKIPGNINIYELQKITLLSPSQAGPLNSVETLFASQTPWFDVDRENQSQLHYIIIIMTLF